MVLAATSTVGAAGAASATPPTASCRPAWTLAAPRSVPGGPVALSQTLAGINSVTALSARNVWFSGSPRRPVRATVDTALGRQNGHASAPGPSASPGRPGRWCRLLRLRDRRMGAGQQRRSDARGDGNPRPRVRRAIRGTLAWRPLDHDPARRLAQSRDHRNHADRRFLGVSRERLGVGLFYQAKPGVTVGTAPTGALIEHWDGTSWSIVPNPASARPGAELSALTVVSPANIWAVGRGQNATGTIVPLVEHWDGRSWRILPVPAGSAPSAFYAVSAHGVGDVWAVGDQTQPGTKNVAAPLAEHWDGDPGLWPTCRMWAMPCSPGSTLRLPLMYGPPSTHQPLSRLVFLHDHGGTWASVPAPGPQAYGLSYYYAGIDGTGPRDIWAVGTASTDSTVGSNPLIARLRCD